jgi:5'-nucleotidase / UDP-sugar diphosphatase
MTRVARTATIGALLLAGAVAARAQQPPVAGPKVAASSKSAAATPATVTLMHFNDVYEIDAIEGGKIGGLARVATVLDRLKRGTSPVISTLGGDFLSPSAIGTARVDGEALAGRQMVDVLNAVGLDWAIFGNHEFDLSESAFHARLAQVKFAIVASNVTDANGKLFEHTVASALVPVRAGGRTIQIGFIGLTIDSTKKPWVRYAPPIDAAKAAIASFAGRADAIVALTHLSLAGDIELVKAVPELDVVLGGHEHENWYVQRGTRLTPVIKADANVRSVAVVTMRFGAPHARPVVVSRLESMDQRVVPNARVDATVKRWVSTAFDAFRRDGFAPEAVVTNITDTLDGRETTVRTIPGKLTDLLTAAMLREAKDADVALMNGGSVRIDDEVLPGPVREYDLIRILPFGGKILKVTMTGSLLVNVLDVGLRNTGTGGFLQLANITRQGGSWLVAGQPIGADKTYKVALPEFLLTGGEAGLGFLQRTNPEVTDVVEFRDIRLALRDELKARYPAR